MTFVGCLGSVQEGVVVALKSDGSFRPMACIHPRCIGQCQQLLGDCPHELLVTATRQIGSANAAGKKHISANQNAIRFTVKDHMAR